ncbi:MAG: protein phosphatase 2C domain-containing protein [Clostridiales Family XIII bacterium]|jgi:protein phosphatase|nr:protein phosphatase 2C domain-containing protein [Clostridiales Family XIII bacterium]
MIDLFERLGLRDGGSPADAGRGADAEAEAEAEAAEAAGDAGVDGEAALAEITEKADSFVVVLTASGTHIGTREYQQDALYVSDTVCFRRGEDPRVLGVLCDGMGGMENGGDASRLVVEALASSLPEIRGCEDIHAFFHDAIRVLDAEISARYGSGSSGTTLTAAVVEGNRLYWASVGDSRVYILRGKEMVQVTRDHNYMLKLQDEVSRGLITGAEAEADPKKEALISYIGAGSVDLIDSNREPFTLISGDIVLMCSDGLTKSLSDEEIADIICEHYGDVRETARLLPLYAFDRGDGSKDNTSVILIQYLE